MGGERGAATVEWVGLLLVVSLALGALGGFAPHVDGRSFGGLISHSIVCAVRGGDCDDGGGELLAAYGEADASLVREHAPNLVYEPGELQLPVDYRDCRSAACAGAPDDPDLDAHRTSAGHSATAFTHVLRDGDETFVQYWLYYPDSNSTVLGADELWDELPGFVRAGAVPFTGSSDWPGYHPDDWESYQVRIDGSGKTWVRASSHTGYQWCKRSSCKNTWGEATGWTRVSYGSHAGHIPLGEEGVEVDSAGFEPVRAGFGADGVARYVPSLLGLRRGVKPHYPGVDIRERTTTAAGVRLIPIDSLDRDGYEPIDPGITPPWEKEVFHDPRSNSTG